MEGFFRFVVHAIWRRRKGVYYAASFISITGNLVVLVGPTVQTSISPFIPVLPQTLLLLQTVASALGSLPEVVQAACTVSVLQIRAWNALPQLAELVLQRSVLYILLNLIVVRIVLNSGVLVGRTSASSSQHVASTKQDELRPVSNLPNIVCGSHWLPPSYLHTVCSTLSFADTSLANPSMLLQHAPHVQGRGITKVADASTRLTQHQVHPPMHYSHKSLPLHHVLTPTTPSPTPPQPSLFTIEPLDELVQSMQPHCAPIIEPQISRRPLQRAATKVDLLQAVRATRQEESRLKDNQPVHQQSGRSMQGVKAKHGIRRKEEDMVQLAVKVGKVGGRRERDEQELDVKGGGGDDDSQLSRQEFNERVDTFIFKFKSSLTMQRKDSLNRLLGLY